jgi:hypothetical protein
VICIMAVKKDMGLKRAESQRTIGVANSSDHLSS